MKANTKPSYRKSSAQGTVGPSLFSALLQPDEYGKATSTQNLNCATNPQPECSYKLIQILW